MIEMLRFLKNVAGIDYFHRQVATKEEFFYHLKSKRKFKGYDIVYLAFHGEQGSIFPSENEEIKLKELSEYWNFFEDRIMHFSSCKTLDYEEDKLKEIKKELGASSLSGYIKDVDWIDSMLLDIAFISLWQAYKVQGHHLKKRLERDYPGLVERLGFVMV